MANSKFLKYQDADGNELIDVCDEIIEVVDPKECPECTPNPAAIVPNWRNLKIHEPFLNEKTCEYQITVTTARTTTGVLEDSTEAEAEAELQDIYEEYEEEAIDGLLLAYNKDDSNSSVSALKEVIDYTTYWLDARPNSHLKLLYSVPKETLDALDDADDDEDEEEEAGDITATFAANEMGPMMLRVRKTFKLYNRYLVVYQAVDKSNLLFLNDNSVFPLKLYGDWGGGSSTLADVLPQLDSFLNSNGYNIANIGGLFQKGSTGGLFSANDRVTEITFTFSNKYKLKKLKFLTEECGQKPIIFTKKCDMLNKESAWKDRTAIAYLANLQDIDTMIQARVPPDWIEVLKKYTYPEIYETNTAVYEETAGSCVAEALREEGKQLGQDILDEVFSIGDAIAYQFKDQLCKASLGEATDEKIKLGLVYDPVSKKDVSIYTMAQMQAFQELEDSEQLFISICARILGMRSGLGNGNAVQMLDQLWAEGFDDIKLCGLMDLMMEALQCLMGGLTLEEAMGKIIERALRAMSITNFGDLFVGLPADKQAELGALVEKKIQSGDVFKDSSSLQAYSDSVASTGETPTEAEYLITSGGEKWVPPWSDDRLSKEEKDQGSPGIEGMTAEEMAATGDRRTLAQQFDIGSEENRGKLDSNVVLEAYIKALLEVYQDNFLELMDELNKFPGAQLIANILALLDCPRPAFFNPSIMDFIKDIELPFCRDLKEITFPRLVNPYGWIPKFWDIIALLKEAFMYALQQLIIAIICKLLVKLCELIGNAICSALEMTGDILAALPDMATGRSSLSDIIKESLCGPDADDDQVDDTIVEMVAALGVGGAALADREKALAFASDVSASNTRSAMAQAMLGEMPDDMKAIIDSLIEYEYPEYRDALPNERSISNFFNNMGSLLPVDFRDTLRDFINELPANDQMPANPTLCATPEQIDAFCEFRSEILAGRASEGQRAQMCDDLKDQMLEDLGDIAAVLQDFPAYIEKNTPPLVSDPGCDNGLIPFEPDVAIATATAALGNELEQLKVDYSTDMLGNGPREKNWGLVNMILSDTMAHPLTAHNRKVSNRRNWVDFYVTYDGEDEPDASDDDKTGADIPLGGIFGLASSAAPRILQRGAYPSRVAEYLRADIESKATTVSASLNNEPTSWGYGTDGFDDEWETSVDKLFNTGLFGGGVNLLKLPDEGYNIELDPVLNSDDEAENIKFTKKGRKANSDIHLIFRDNAKGLVEQDESVWSYGFDLEVFFGDLVEVSGSIVNRADDNVRILITDQFNMGSDVDPGAMDLLPPEEKDDVKRAKKSDQILPNLKYEFLAVDDTLSELGMQVKPAGSFDSTPYDEAESSKISLLDVYTDFQRAFEVYNKYTPQTILMRELLNEKNGSSLSDSAVEAFREEVMTSAMQMILSKVAENTGSWAYGAKYDTLSAADLEYGIVGDSDEWTPYDEAKNSEGERLRNRDAELGISYMQYQVDYEGRNEENRVFYLDPLVYGGNYMNPPIYIKPLKNEGWLGMVDVLFPDLSPCKPQSTDLIDFGSIQEIVDDIYPSIAEDERLKSDPDCIEELPYNRILARPAKAGLVGLITAAIRIYVSAHYIKALPVFTTFAGKFPDSYSSAFASYIVEHMENSFRDPAGGKEIFTLFKDDEFWYAFLEQAVQIYAVMVDEGKVNPPANVLEALFRLNDLQEAYEYPGREELRDAKEADLAGNLETLKSYRQDKNLEAVQSTDEDAKLILQEMVMTELNFIGKKFGKNLKSFGMEPQVKDMEYFLMDEMTVGSTLTLNSAVNADGSFNASYIDIETEEGDEYYTSGGEFTVGEELDEESPGKGEEYIGFYHITLDEDGMPMYMAGEFHTDDELHDVLYPMVYKIEVPIGDVPELDDYSVSGGSSEQPFVIEKYISINGKRMAPTEAISQIKTNNADDLTKNISDIYPGTLELVKDANDATVGMTGKLGVRYGLQFSVIINGSAYEITAVEVDALDLTIAKLTNVTEDSKLLLCLLNLLKSDYKFKLTSRYMFSLTKLTSIAAIYTTQAFLPSIGETTVKKGETYFRSGLFNLGSGPGAYLDRDGKPGMTAIVTTGDSDGVTVVENVEETVVDKDNNYMEELEGKWASIDDRHSFWSWGVLEYDDWDQLLLRNSKKRIKKLFKTYYNSRDFDPDDISKAVEGGPGQIFFNRLREALKPAPGKRLLPWWRRRMLRTNPFNANGELCQKED